MTESEGHKEMREEIQDRLDAEDMDLLCSHEAGGERKGPALYIEDPEEEVHTKRGCQVSQPDIVVVKDDTIDFVEIESSEKSPKYLFSDLYAVHNAQYIEKGEDDFEPLTDNWRLFVMVTAERDEFTESRSEQYEHLKDRSIKEHGRDKFKIYWKEELEDMIQDIVG